MASNQIKQTSQEIAKKFFEERTEKNYTTYYQTFSPIAKRSARNVMKNDPDKQDDVVSKVMIKMWNTDSFVFDDTKSHESYISLMAHNFALMEYNKNKPVRQKKIDKLEELKEKIKASEVVHGSVLLDSESGRYDIVDVHKMMHIRNFSEFDSDDSDDSDNIIENIGFKHRITEEENIGNYDYEIVLSMIKEISKERSSGNSNGMEMSEEEFCAFVVEALQISAKLHLKDQSIENVSYKDLKTKYGFNSEGAIKSRIHRIRLEIKKREAQMELYKRYRDGELVTGTVRCVHTIDIEDILNMIDDDMCEQTLKVYTKFVANMVNSKLHGEFISFHENGNKSIECYYYNGKKHGTYVKYYEDGTMWMKGSYSNGVKNSEFHIYEDDNIIVKEEFHNGKRIQFTSLVDGAEIIEIEGL